MPVAETVPVVLRLPPVMLPVAETKPVVSTLPAVLMLPPVMLPVAETKPVVSTLPSCALPVTLTTPAVLILAPVMLPLAEIKPVVTLALLMLPKTVSRLADLSNVKLALAPKMSPVSLNCTSVMLPAASMLPEILPIKLLAVILPEAEILPVVKKLPPITLPVTDTCCRVKELDQIRVLLLPRASTELAAPGPRLGSA